MTTEHIHFQVLAALALSEGKEEAHELLPYVSSESHDSLKNALESLEVKYPDNLEEAMPQHIQSLAAQESFSGIADIHPAWLVEALKKESPRVIGVILRHLPSKHVRYLLEHLPHQTVVHLPKLVEAFYVPNEILKIVCARFERHFVPMRVAGQIESFEFQHLPTLKIEELDHLFRDLGLSELALSLVGSPRNIARSILHRFGVREAKEIVSRMRRFETEDKWLLNDAKYSILELGGEALGADSFLKELGLKAFSKAFSRSNGFLFKALRQKLAPDNAHLFRRFLEEQFSCFHKVEQTQKRQEWILAHLNKQEKEETDSEPIKDENHGEENSQEL